MNGVLFMSRKVHWEIGDFMKVKKICLAAICLLTSLQSAFAVNIGDANDRHYQAFFYELAEKGYVDSNNKNNYDADFDKSFARVIAQKSRADHRFREKITSGPSTQGKVINVKGVAYVEHEICQAHQCSDYKMITMYEPLSKKMYGVLFDHCKEEKFGEMPIDVAAAIENEHSSNKSNYSCR